MSKAAVTYWLLLYMIPTFGVNINVHYCGGDLSAISFGAKSGDSCDCGKKKMKGNCCEDISFSFEVAGDQALTQASQLTFSNLSNLQVLHPLCLEFCCAYSPSSVAEYGFHHPPNNAKLPLYITNQVFLI